MALRFFGYSVSSTYHNQMAVISWSEFCTTYQEVGDIHFQNISLRRIIREY